MWKVVNNIGFIGSGKLTQACISTAPKSTLSIRFTTTTDHNKLKGNNQAAIPLMYYDSLQNNPNTSFLSSIDKLIIIIAPSQERTYQHTYSSTVESISSIIHLYPNIDTIVYVSSTSVYTNQDSASEMTHLDPNKMMNQQKVLFNAEKILLGLQSRLRKIIVIRAGRILDSLGPHINTENLYPGSGLEPINFIYRIDLSRMIWHLIENKNSGIYNAVHPEHPTRKEFYMYWHNIKNLPQPSFTNETAHFHLSNKIVSSDRILKSNFIFTKDWKA